MKSASAPPSKSTRLLARLEDNAALVAGAAAATVFVGGVIYSLVLGPELRYHDENVYLALARGLVDLGKYTLDGSTPTAFYPPGYPVFLSLGVGLGASVPTLRIPQFACLALSILLLYRLVSRIGGPLPGAIAAIIALTYPIFFYTAGVFYPQTLGSTLLLLALLIVAQADRPPSVAQAAAAGLVFGVLILCIPTFLFSFGLVGVWVLVTYRRRALTACATGLTVALLVVGSWQIRNYRVFGELFFVSTNSGVNLLIGNSEHATSDSGVNADISSYRAAAKALSPVERNRFYRDSAFRWVAENPVSAMKLYAAKVLHYFDYRDQLATKSEAHSARELLMLMSYGPLLLLAVSRISLWRRFPIQSVERLLIVLFFSNALFMALFFTRIRFRIPLDYVLIALAATCISFVLRRACARFDESR